MPPKKYDSTVARIAGNIISGLSEELLRSDSHRKDAVVIAVETARWIVEETKRTEPEPTDG